MQYDFLVILLDEILRHANTRNNLEMHAFHLKDKLLNVLGTRLHLTRRQGQRHLGPTRVQLLPVANIAQEEPIVVDALLQWLVVGWAHLGIIAGTAS
jgi:hypothetical protein